MSLFNVILTRLRPVIVARSHCRRLVCQADHFWLITTFPSNGDLAI